MSSCTETKPQNQKDCLFSVKNDSFFIMKFYARTSRFFKRNHASCRNPTDQRTQLPKNCPYFPCRTSVPLLAFMPICMRASSHRESPFTPAKIPLIPPSSPRNRQRKAADDHGQQQLGSNDRQRTECAPQQKQGQRHRRPARQMGKSFSAQDKQQKHKPVGQKRASFATTTNLARNRSSGGTGLAMIRFQLCP